MRIGASVSHALLGRSGFCLPNLSSNVQRPPVEVLRNDCGKAQRQSIHHMPTLHTCDKHPPRQVNRETGATVCLSLLLSLNI